jgi:carbamoyl-phosphate synthase large subunit
MKNNVLILSAGRRVELVNFFKDELKKLLPDSRVFAVDLKPELSSACQVAHSFFKAPRVTSDEYIPFLKKICLDENIGLVVPTIDTELLVLSKHRDYFTSFGINVVVSEFNLVDYCRNKNLTKKVFDDLGISYPTIFNKDAIEFPCFMKPYDGSCSIGAKAIPSSSDLTDLDLKNPKNMFMELIPCTYKEYTVDAYYDKFGDLKCFVPRLRIETRAGEISKGVTRKNHVYNFLMDKLDKLNGAYGCITIQLFVSEDDLDYKGLEINPRFGGGFPLSYSAGANYPKMMIREYILGENLSFEESWKNNFLMLRYDASVFIENYESK